MADDVGSLILREGLVSPDQLAAARKEATNVGGTVPEQLVQQGHIADEALTSFYRKRLLIPRVNPTDLEKLSARLLEKVPPDMATEFRSIPVALDDDGNLTVVMSDPSDSQAVDEIAFFTGNYVVRAIATQAQIAWCLAHYYQQKTRLFLGLVADGKFAGEEVLEHASAQRATPTPNVPEFADVDETETGPMKIQIRPAKKRGKQAGQAKPDDPAQNTGEHEVVARRPSNQLPSPAELFARAGEISSAQLEQDHPVSDTGPAVVIAMGADSDPDGAAQPEDTNAVPAQLLLQEDRVEESPSPAPDKSEGDPIVLNKSERKKRRRTKRTNVGLGSVGKSTASKEKDETSQQGKQAKPGDQAVKREMPPSPLASAIQERSKDLVGGEWGAPGTTIPPDYIGASPAAYDDLDSAIPEAIDDGKDTSPILDPDVSAPVAMDSAEDATVRNQQPEGVSRSTPHDAATNLLLAVRNIDRSDDRAEVVEAVLKFLDVGYERSAFMALRKDDLVVWRTHNCADDNVRAISVTKDSTFRTIIETRQPYNGRLADDLSRRLARDLDIPDALDMFVLPISLRDRVIGSFVALGSFDPINEDHITVLSQAVAEGFERIVLAGKK